MLRKGLFLTVLGLLVCSAGYCRMYQKVDAVVITDGNGENAFSGDSFPTSVMDKAYLDTFIVGTGSKVAFPTTEASTQTYGDTVRWHTISSTYIDSSNYGDFISIDTSVAQAMGVYASGTVTSGVFDRQQSSTATITSFVITITDSTSTGVETTAYSRRTGSDSPPTGSWITYTSGTNVPNSDRYIQWRGVLTSGNSQTQTPQIHRVNLQTWSYYSNFKIYAIGVSMDNTADSASLTYTGGATEIAKDRLDMKAGTSDYRNYVSPITISGTGTITVGSGMRAKIQYLQY